MIAAIKQAILHILDASHQIPIISEREMDVNDAMINTYITRIIERVYDDSAYRKGEFMSNSGLKHHMNEYKSGGENFIELSANIANRLFDALKNTEDPKPCDIVVCSVMINERDSIAILKLDNKVGVTHRVDKDEDGILCNLINHYAILPAMTQKIGEYAFIMLDDLSIRYRGGNYKIDGEKADLFADILLECDYEISSREAVNTVTRAAKRVTAENGGDMMETAARMKECVIDSIEERENLDTEKIANHIFDGRPAMLGEFKAKMENGNVPPQIEVNKYVTKKITSDIKLTTDIGVELSFPAEYYNNADYVDIINNDDGTISIVIRNIGELTNK